MNRDDIRDQVLSATSHSILCELPTGVGKSKIALDYMDSKLKHLIDVHENLHILIVVPRLVLISNWESEFVKWGKANYLPYVEFVTYVSFPKKVGIYDMIIFDEAHHFSERCRDAFEDFLSSYTLLLSATVGRNMRYELKSLFADLEVFHITARTAIQEEILPDPKVYLIPLQLDNTRANYTIVKNKSQKVELRIPYSQRFAYSKIKNRRIVIECTQQQYYDDISSKIAWYKRKMFIEVFKNKFLQESGIRLKWLSEQKTGFVEILLENYLQDQRTLTFCNGISQTEELGKYCVNSKNKDSEENLEKFNKGKINHITACNMLDEGVNLTNCRVGVYATLNSSDRMITQKLGRLLRHPEPILIIPYFKNTRDEEIVGKMIEDYNPELVTTITNLNQLTL
jgi:superfamily II DNA or RNA helicase